MPRSILEDELSLAAGYVLGDLSATEVTEFESNLATNQDLQTEVYALQAAFGKLPQGLPQVSPPPRLKAKLVDSFLSEASSQTAVDVQTASLAIPPKSGMTWGRGLAGIGLFLGGLLAFDNFNLRQQLQFAQQINQQELANVLSRPKSRLVSLNTQENQVVGNVLFTPGSWQQVIVSVKSLPPLPVNRVYRMWLELVNGQVIPCGEFKTNAQGEVFVKLNAQQAPPTGVKAKGVYVTIEQPNAPLQPTGQKVIEGII